MSQSGCTNHIVERMVLMDRFDIGRAFRVPFEDPGWVNKTLMALVWSLLVVTLPAIYGAQVEYIRGVAKGDETLPDWDGFGQKWVDGLLVALAGFVYFLPVLALGAVLFLPAIIAGVAGGDSGALGALVGGGTCIFVLVSIVYTAAVSVFYSAAITHFAMRGSFGAFFDLKGIAALVRGKTGYFTAWLYVLLISVGVSAISGFLTGATAGFGGILMGAVSYLAAMMSGHVLGQWASVAYARTAPAPFGAAGQQSSPPPPPPPPAAY